MECVNGEIKTKFDAHSAHSNGAAESLAIPMNPSRQQTLSLQVHHLATLAQPLFSRIRTDKLILLNIHRFQQQSNMVFH